jgi:saccharopine dehydrogenase (NAD+, L-glutamate forming)
VSKKKVRGGFWTPATVFGDRIIERLQQHSGVKFEVLDT